MSDDGQTMRRFQTVRRFYGGFAARDGAAILAELHPEFVGQVSAGMPLRVGGHHGGPEAMLRDVWGRVATVYDVAPEPDEVLDCGDDRMVAVGAYRGVHRASGSAVNAAFAHILRLRDGKICELVQITDTASWPAE